MKNKIILSIAIGLPILIIIGVALSIYLPSKMGKPSAYDFIYESGADYYGQYQTENGKVTKSQKPDPKYVYSPYYAASKLYIHTTATNSNKIITFEETQKLKLSEDAVSPDGYKVQRGQGGDNLISAIFGGSNYYNKYYLIKDRFSQELNLSSTDYNTHFLGWIIK